jgi:predicted ribosomally synthesized peptide with SipW-like signal peptide
MSDRYLTRGQKITTSIALLLLAAALAGIGAYATFTDSASASHTVTTGTVAIDLGATGSSTNRLNVDASAVAPGDTIQRSFDLINSGSLNLSGISLTTNATTTSLLDTDATDGLQMVIQRCSNAWTESGSSPAFTYTCSGSTSSVVASRAVIGNNISLSNLTVTSAGATDHLRLTLSLPTTAGNSFQGVTSTISYTFTGTQRAGTDR